ANLVKDAWGRSVKLVKRAKPGANPTGWPQFNDYELVSAGPDGKFGTKDDVKSTDQAAWYGAQWWWLGEQLDKADQFGFTRLARLGDNQRGMMRGGAIRDGVMMQNGAAFGGGIGGMQLEQLRATGMRAPMAPMAARPMAKRADRPGQSEAKSDAAQVEPTRVREYFPETMLWQPALITDDQGRADLLVRYPDSITTWRLSASASSRGGLLGGVSAPLRVFQDFFVDLDLPVSLTQNDEVAFPVAVYNYLKEPQIVKLELQRDPWFELIDSAGPTRTLDLKPNEVTSVKFRIKARRIGFHPLTVKARGSKLADAIKRGIEVVPDGVKVEKVVTDRLSGRISQTIDIPQDALADASKILVKVYPGIMSQVMEGTEGMLRLPGG
ncbi:MAG TPA: alpha-2-macroglobulin family protein, partial [Pirellulales bacterium]|nr:alpha-2-macroglobulin family protein [Pirellulales bacterium]